MNEDNESAVTIDHNPIAKANQHDNKTYTTWEDITGSAEVYQQQLKAQEPKDQEFNQIRPIKELFKLIDRKDRLSLMLSSVLAFFGELFGLVPFLLVALVVNEITKPNFSLNKILYLSLGILGAFLLRVILTYYSTLISHHTAFNCLAKIRKKIAQKMLRVPLGNIMNSTSGALKNLIVENVQRLEDSMAHYIPEMSSNLSAPVLFLIAIFTIDWRMGLASLITLPISFIGFVGMMQDYQRRSNEYLINQNKMNSTVIEYINGIQVIKAFNQSTESYKKYSDSIIAYVHTTTDWCINTWKWMSLVFAVMPTTLLGTLPFGTYLLMKHSISLDTFIVCNILPLGFIIPMIRVIQYTSNLTLVKTALFYITNFLNQKELDRPQDSTHCELDLEQGFKFEHVSFDYDNCYQKIDQESKHQALTDVSFEIKPHTINAIVGQSGSGKTTIARLMASFWDCTEGNISFGGVNIKSIPTSQLYDYISYVSQDNYLFDLTIRDNIALGNPNATQEQIETVAKATCCHDFILSLPNGYNTHVGDSGIKLSGGEKQRISLARAMLKDAPIVILDEATAYADPENEFYMQQAISRLCKNKTLIVVAHRLYTIKDADNILVMNNGKLVESGTHQDLINNQSYYYNLWHASSLNN